MLKSKLKTSYKTADPSEWLIGNWQDLDPVFAGRLAYFAECTKTKIKLTEAYRSTARQTELYSQYLEYKRTGKGNIKSAAKPGSSWHEFRLAIDTSTYPMRGYNNAQLAKYGLCKPISSEGWHLQPIETMGLSGNANRVKWQPIEQEEEDMVKVYQSLNELTGDWKEAVQWAVKAGIIKGNGKTLSMTESEVKSIVFIYRDNLRRGTI